MGRVGGRSNMANASARAKARKASLIDSTRMRQLLQQSPDAIGTSIAEFGYRSEIDLYAGRYTGADLIEAALNHNLDSDFDSSVFDSDSDNSDSGPRRSDFDSSLIQMILILTVAGGI